MNYEELMKAPMTYLADEVLYFMDRAKQPIGNPNPMLAARLIAEEAIETVNALGFNVVTKLGGKFELVPITVAGVGNKPVDLVETLDGLADTMYVCEWAFLNLGYPDKPFLDEVCHNNNLKVIDPKFDENGKVMKPVGHPKPDIAGIIARLDSGFTHYEETIDKVHKFLNGEGA
jgi:predicted HAD superfamily Cof-like phosphohydrolase